MAKTYTNPKNKKSARLGMAMSQADRALIDRAAALLGIPAGIWSRIIITKAAQKVVDEHKALKK